MKTIAILGASVRAAAFSALRAGFVPIGLDRFADVDLRRRATVVQIDRWPEGCLTAFSQCGADAWMYTGGIENHPDLVERLNVTCPLWGNRGPTLVAVRDPFQVAKAFAHAGIPVPTPAKRPDGLPRDGSWLVKPLRGSGGFGIRPWLGAGVQSCAGAEGVPSPGRASGYFFQPRVKGIPCSAVFVGASGRATFLGATRQLVGESWTGAAEFSYAGSIGPLRLDANLANQWQRIGNCLAERFLLTGLFGVDAIADGETVWPVEVNPRYSASVEVLEQALGIFAVRLHADACSGRGLADVASPSGSRWYGKAILYAATDLVISRRFSEWANHQIEAWPWPHLADVPEVNAPIRRGKPVTTVFAEANDKAGVYNALEARLDEVKRLLVARSVLAHCSGIGAFFGPRNATAPFGL